MEAGYVLKFQRAGHHLEDFIAKYRSWLQQKPYTSVCELDPDGSYQYRHRIISSKPMPSDQFAIIIGDALYNLRSSLDNLAFDLNGGDHHNSESEFPIFGNITRSGKPCAGATDHRGQISKKIRGMCSSAQTLIEGLQPYNRGDSYAADPLWLLNSLCNIDKHRSIHIVNWAFGGFVIYPRPCKNFGGVAENWSYSGPLETGTIIARYNIKILDPQLEVEVCMEPKAEIAFADGPCKGESVRVVLRTLCEYVSKCVINPLANFL